MTWPLSIYRIAVIWILMSVLATTSTAGDRGYKVVVHPANPEVVIERELLRDVFLKKATAWHGQPIQPIDLACAGPTRDQFTREVLQKTPAQLKRYWNRQIFSGQRLPPPEADTPAEVIAYVLAHPGAVGYLPSEVDPGATRVVEVK